MQISCQHGGVLAPGIGVRIITLLCVYVCVCLHMPPVKTDHVAGSKRKETEGARSLFI